MLLFMIQKVNKPIQLYGAKNVRELGGYPTKDGKRITRRGVFLRGDGTHALTPEDIDIIAKMGVTLVVDMRSPDEVKQYPSRLSSVKGVDYENVVMFDLPNSALSKDKLPGSMAELYCLLLSGCKQQYGRIFRLFLNNRGASLFHCTAGKDRTGVVAMLLLQLAGVSDSMIAADYSVSEQNTKGMFDKQHEQYRKLGIEVPDFVFRSRAEDMHKTLEFLYSKYGGAAEYLMKCGLAHGEINQLIVRFVE